MPRRVKRHNVIQTTGPIPREAGPGGGIPSAPGPAIRVIGLRKSFGPTVALADLDLSIAAGESHAILGENGAGKSTLVKLLSGLVQPDAGTIEVFGAPVRLGDPRAAHQIGLRTAFQEISLVRDLTVAQNFLLMEEPLSFAGTIRRRRAERLVRDTLAGLGLGDIDPRTRVSSLDLATRQKLEIARAVARRPRILLLDEPTAALSAQDVAWLGGLIAEMKRAGTTIVLISHRMQDVRDFCSRLTILRNGRAVGTHAVDSLTDEAVIELMIGRSLDVVFPPRPTRPPQESWAAPAIAADGFATVGAGPVSFDLMPGEILGIAALQGMGQQELFLALFGARAPTAGALRIRGEEARFRSPADAVDPRWGLGLVPEDRKAEGLFLDLDGRENTALPSLDRFTHGGLVDAGIEQREVSAALDAVQVASRALWTPVRQFSGGNQQKIILAKWLLTGAPVLLLFDPTRGVDVGTKAEIYRLMRAYADRGGAILFHSTDIAELVNLCDRAMVLYRGRASAVLGGADLTDTAIMRAAIGQGEGGASDVRH
jgi:ribose transport system ATP-binding protein